MISLDTNILIDADDARDPRRRRRARELVRSLIQNRRGVLSLQVLQEFFAAATRKLGMSSEDARLPVVLYSRFDTVTLAPADLLATIDLQLRPAYVISLCTPPARSIARPAADGRDRRDSGSVARAGKRQV